MHVDILYILLFIDFRAVLNAMILHLELQLRFWNEALDACCQILQRHHPEKYKKNKIDYSNKILFEVNADS